MTLELTPQEIEAINREAEIEYPDILIEERGVLETWEMYEINDMQAYKREAYAAALTSERLKQKAKEAEIQAYRYALDHADEVLAHLEDFTHGKDGMAITAARYDIQQTLNHFK